MIITLKRKINGYYLQTYIPTLHQTFCKRTKRLSHKIDISIRVALVTNTEAFAFSYSLLSGNKICSIKLLLSFLIVEQPSCVLLKKT